MTDDEVDKMAEALKRALLSDHTHDAYMFDNDPLDCFLIDGRIDLRYVVRTFVGDINRKAAPTS